MGKITPLVPRDLVDALAAGDEAAWSSFLGQHDPLIRAVAGWRKWRFDEATRQDVAQKVRVDLQRAFKTYRGECGLEQLVKQIGIRRCIDEVRRQVRERRIIEPTLPDEEHGGTSHAREAVADESFDPVRAIVLSERATRLRQVLDGIDETCRTIIKQFYLEQQSYRDMASRNSIAVNTVGSRLSKCLDKLRLLIRKDPALGEELAS